MKLPQILMLASMLGGALLFSGCATVTRGSSEQLMVQSVPSSAQVKLSNGFTGVTPVSFTVPRKGAIVVTVSKEGYETAQVEVTTHVSGAGTAGFLGNALIGGVIGGGIDVATGAALSHTPNPVNVTLVPLKPAATPPVEATPAATSASSVPEAKVTEQKKSEDSASAPATGAGAAAPVK